MSLDFTALRRAVRRHRSSHEARPDRRKTTGATALIRAALPEIRRLRDVEGQPWAVIAAALGEQGVHEGQEGRPIGADRLIALVRHIEAQIERKAAKRAGKSARSDVAPPVGLPRSATQSPAASGPVTRLRLASELQPRPAAAVENEQLSEDAIRRENLARLQHLLKD